jgi:hypothetical protein
MSRVVTTSTRDTLQTVSRLLDIGNLDTLYRDLYSQRARELLATTLSRVSYDDLKEKAAELPWLEQQLHATVERGEWKRASELIDRVRRLRTRLSAAGQSMKLAETVYERASVSIGPFSTGLGVFVGASNESLAQSRGEALSLLESLKRSDPKKSDFYARRGADFKALSIVAGPVVVEEKKPTNDPAQLKNAALGALESGDLSRLNSVIESIMKESQAKEKETRGVEVELAEAKKLGEDLLFEFSQETLDTAREFGLSPVRTKSRRQLAYLIPHGWQPSFRKDDVKQWSKDQLSRLTFPTGPSDRTRDAIEFYLLNPFITSAGTRYQVCLVAEDLLVEDFPEPDAKEEVFSELLSSLKLPSRWGMSRLEIEDALLENGSAVISDLHLDPEAFRLVLIPPDLYTHLGPDHGWGHKEMWTHFDGYRVLEGGKLQALAGGDKRFGGTLDVVSFGPDYVNAKIFTRFAVVQRKRMMDWQTGLWH